MSYFAPLIDATGLRTPTYQDIEDYLVAQARRIYGADIYLENDSQDFQLIAALAQAAYDCILSVQLAYNNRTPGTATGAALDGLVALNGLTRQQATRSTASVTLTGTAFTAITNGVVSDINGYKWDLPASVIIGAGGTVTVTASCESAGPITALVGQINVIQTPTLGWTSVTNAIAATPGRSIELDSELRQRQVVSVANPSQALTTGILGGVLSVPNVVSAQLYENDTSSPVGTINGVPNPSNYPANSITVVVDGGDGQAIASQIANRKTPGAYTNGDQIYSIVDAFGVPSSIRFYRPTATPISVALTIRALNGYSSALGDAVKKALVDYLNSLTGGQSVILSELWQAALSADPNAQPAFSLTALTAAITGNSLATADIILNFNQKATSVITDVALTVTS